jgi:phytoene dehydrogenase-like protein
MLLGPLRWPRSPLLLARFGRSALRSLRGLAEARFREPYAKALLAGIAAHSMLPLGVLGTASFALVLGMAGHRVGWPLARGGSQAISDALVRCLRAHGGELRTGVAVKRLEDLPRARAYLLDLTPRQLVAVAGDALPERYRRRLRRFRHGPGSFKLDWALAGPIPWADPRCARSATVHLAGDLDEIDRAEQLPHAGEIAAEPFVLLVQPTLFDPSRAPAGRHIAWAYCHVPNGSARDATTAIEDRIERFAPGFRERILARAARSALDLEAYNPNFVGGDISGGQNDLAQLFTRPVARLDPYSTPAPHVFLCSSSTPPGGGVHGMCGYFAARSALRRVFQRAV